MARYLSPQNDIAFKKIFGDIKNKDILIHFLNDVLNKGGEDSIKSIVIQNTEQPPEIEGLKESILDVLCTDHRGIRYIVEMQIAGRKGFTKRAQYYAAKAYSNQMKEGQNYYDLKEVVFLAILDFVMFPDKADYKSEHVTLDKKNYEHDLKDFSFTFIELPKFTITNLDELDTYEKKWCYFFKHASEPESMPQFLATIGQENSVIHKAYQVLESHYWTQEELDKYDRMEKINLDMRAREAFVMETAEARGIEIGEARGIEIGEARGIEIGEARGIEIGEARGIEIGEATGIRKVAKSLKQLGLSCQQIQESTGLSLEEIQQLYH